MAGVAQLVRASDCGPEGRRFNPGHSPHKINLTFVGFILIKLCITYEFFSFFIKLKRQLVSMSWVVVS